MFAYTVEVNQLFDPNSGIPSRSKFDSTVPLLTERGEKKCVFVLLN